MINITIVCGNRYVWFAAWLALVSTFTSAVCWAAFMLVAAIANLIKVIG